MRGEGGVIIVNCSYTHIIIGIKGWDNGCKINLTSTLLIHDNLPVELISEEKMNDFRSIQLQLYFPSLKILNKDDNFQGI